MPAKVYSAGTAFLTVVPSFLGVEKAMEAEVAKAARKAEATIADALPKGMAEGAKKAAEHGDKAGADFSGAFQRKVKQNLTEAWKSIPEPDPDQVMRKWDRAMAKFRSDLKSFSKEKIGISIDQDTFNRAIEQFRARAQELRDSAPANKDAGFYNANSADSALGKIEDLINEAHARGEAAGEAFRSTFEKKVTAGVDKLIADIPPLKPDVDPTEAQAKLEELRLRASKLKADMELGLDAGSAYVELKAIGVELNRLDRKHVDVDVRTNAHIAAAGIAQLTKEAEGADSAIRGIGDASGLSISRLGYLIGLGASLGSVLVPAALSAAAAIGSIGTMAAAGISGIGVFALGISGVSDAVKALDKYTNDQAKSTNSLNQANRGLGRSTDAVAQAEASLANTRENVASQAEAAARRVADAEQRVGEARREAGRAAQEAADKVEEAQRRLTSAESDARDVRESLNEAYKDAARSLRDLDSAVKRNAIDQEQATTAIMKAKQELDKVITNPRATEIERRTAQETYAEKLQQLEDLKNKGHDLAEDQAAANKAGIEGSKQVVAARKQIADADERVADAQRQLAKARDDQAEQAYQSNKKIADAQQAVADAQRAQQEQARQGAFQIAQATQAITNAKRQEQQAWEKTGIAGGEALSNLNQQMAMLSPEARAFARYIFGLKDEVLALRDAASRPLLPKLQEAIEMLRPYLPSLARFIGNVAGELGNLAVKAVQSLGSPVWQRFFQFIDATAVPSLQQMFDIGSNLTEGLISLFLALTPFNKSVGTGLVDLSRDFATWAERLDRSQGYRDFLEYVRENGPKVVEFLGEAGKLLIDLVQAAMPLGTIVLGILTAVADGINSIPTPALAVLVTTIGLVAGAVISLGGVMKAIKLKRELEDIFGPTAQKLVDKYAIETGRATEETSKFGKATATIGGVVGTATDKIKGMGGASGIASSAIGKLKGAGASLVGFLGGPWGIALTGAALAIGYLTSKYEEHKAKARSYADALGTLTDEYRDLAATGKASGPAVEQMFQNVVRTNPDLQKTIVTLHDLGLSINEIMAMGTGQQGPDKIIAAITKEQERLNDEMRKPGNFFDVFDNQDRQDKIDELEDMKQGFIDNAKALGLGSEAMDLLNKKTEQSTDIFKSFTGQTDLVKKAMTGGATTADDYNNALSALSSITTDASGKSLALAGIADKVAHSQLTAAEKTSMFQNVLGQLGNATSTSGPVFDSLTQVFNSIATSALNASDKSQLLTQTLGQLYGAVRAQDEAADNLITTQSRLHEQLQTNSAGFDRNTAASGVNTDAIMSNRSALREALKAAEATYVQDLANNVQMDVAKRKHDDAVTSILAGISPTQRQSAAVQEMVRQYGTVPDKVETPVTSPGLDKAIDDLITAHAVQLGLSKKPPWDKDVIESEAKLLRNAVMGRKGSWADKLAEGGPVRGFSPTKTADNIPLWGTAGEWMQPVDSVEYYGTDVMEAMRTRSIPREFFQARGFASGGAIWPIEIKHDINAPSAAEMWKQYEATMAAGLATGAPNFSGPAGQSYPSIISFARMSGVPFTVSSTYRPGDPGWHGKAMAADMYDSAANMVKLAQWFGRVGNDMLEVIHSGGGGIFFKNGRRVGWGYYGAATEAQHYNHVHVAATNAGIAAARSQVTGGNMKLFDEGGWMPPGTYINPATGDIIANASNKPEPVFNHRQWADMRQLVAAGTGGRGGDTHYYDFKNATLDESQMLAMQRRRDALNRVDRDNY